MLEVNEKTDCRFEYEPVRHGRKVVEIRFIYKTYSEIEELEAGDEKILTTTFTEEDEDEDEKLLEIYGSEKLVTLAEGCMYEFDKEQMEQIARVLVRIDIPKDPATDSTLFGKQFYLMEKYAALNTEAARKLKRGDKPIKNRFKYFLKMLEDDTSRPLAYKEE